jgi:cytochrome c2
MLMNEPMSNVRRSERLFWTGWCALTLALLSLIPSTRFGIPPWELPAHELLPFLILVGGFVACAVVPAFMQWRGKTMSAGIVLLWILAVFGLLFIGLTVATMSGSLRVYAEVLALAALLLPITFAQQHRSGLILGALAVLIVVALGSSLYLAYGPQPRTPIRTKTVIVNSAFYNLEAVYYEGRIPIPAVPGGGGLAKIAGQYLLTTGDGKLYLFGWHGSPEQLDVKSLPYRIPINGEEFSAAVGLPYERPRETIAVGEATGPQVDVWRFRVSDILLQELGDRIRLFAGHHYWEKAHRCFVVRVSMAESDRAAFLNGTAQLMWKTLYDSTPCLPIEGELRERASPFEGNLSGGRLALLDPDSLLFTVGFHGFDGVGSRQLYSQDPEASWGTTVLIHVDRGTSEMFANGQRNQQGLYVDPRGGIWETEHGPRGGDELNFVEKGVNYGWPYVTYGTNYVSLVWPLSKAQGRHDGYREPIFAWVPSIGISNLISIEKDMFPVWKEDLLVSSLRAESLFRIHLVDRRAVVVEPIPVNRRIRTLIEGFDGRIILWTEDAAIVSIKPAVGTSRELLFATQCGGCHKVEGATNIIGPDLLHVYGRKVATAAGYDEYSEALKKVSGRWDEEKLNRFLANPQAMVPGTRMPFAGIADPGDRAAIVDYLKSLSH